MSLKPCCEHTVYEHRTVLKDAGGNTTSVLACDVCPCRQFSLTRVKDPWWKREAMSFTWLEMIGLAVAMVVVSFLHGAYDAWRAGPVTCVTVKHGDLTDDYRVCGQREPVKREYQ